jgi:RND family efflux transporter MFP subunit
MTEPVRKRGLVIVGVVIVLTFIVLFAVGLLPRLRQGEALAASAKSVRESVPVVYVTQPKPAVEGDLMLAATTSAFQDTTIYARTSGYIRKRYVDIGDTVKAGQLLAEIDSPEIDQQLNQAVAELASSRQTVQLQGTARELARVTKGRYEAADSEKAVAKEMVDQSVAAERTASANVAAAEANVESNVANVKRLQAMTAFERVLAPFAGTITRRNVDTGALITAGSATSNTSSVSDASGLFGIAQLDVLRVFVSVPQVNAPNVTLGMPVKVTVRGRLMEPVTGTVTRTASALDPTTRTLLVEVDLPNKAHELLPGMFVYVSFRIAPSGTRWRLPATAVVIDADGTRVVTIADGNKLHFQPVTLGRDFGGSIDIQAGLTGQEQVVAQPRVSMHEGQTVQPKAAAPARAGGS